MIQTRKRRRNQRRRKETLHPLKNEEKREAPNDYPDLQSEGPDLQSGDHPDGVLQDEDPLLQDEDPLLQDEGHAVQFDVPLLTNANDQEHRAALDLRENVLRRGGESEEGAKREDREVRIGDQKVERKRVNLQRRKEQKQNLPRGNLGVDRQLLLARNLPRGLS